MIEIVFYIIGKPLVYDVSSPLVQVELAHGGRGQSSSGDGRGSGGGRGRGGGGGGGGGRFGISQRSEYRGAT